MAEKICNHCGTILLVGLQYCPGCMRAIDGDAVPVVHKTEAAPEESSAADTFFVDLETMYERTVYPAKSLYAYVFKLPEPASPPPVPAVSRGFAARSNHGQNTRPTVSLGSAYTRVACPKCQRPQRGAFDLLPADMLTCQFCQHRFPGSFAAEFRKGADLECMACGVTTFCVTGSRVTVCPNCRFKSNRIAPKARLRFKIAAAIVYCAFLGFFVQAINNHTTAHFLFRTCLALVAAFFGFIIMIALGF